MDKQLFTRGFLAGMKAGGAALATVAWLHLGVGVVAAETLTWKNDGTGKTYTWTQTTKVSRDRLAVPLCVRIPSTGDTWGGAQVGTMTAQGDDTFRLEGGGLSPDRGVLDCIG